MNIYKRSSLITGVLLAIASSSTIAGVDEEGYYGSIKGVFANQTLKNMDLTSPRALWRTESPESENKFTGSLGVGYQFGNGWRTEGEYTIRRNAEFGSYFYPFDGSVNSNRNINMMSIATQRLMLNGYRDFELTNGFSVYGSLGVGIAAISAKGYQGNETRDFASLSETNLVYSIGAGVSYSPIENLSLDLGYRYVDLGKISTDYGQFPNFGYVPPGLAGTNNRAKDERLTGHLVSSEFTLGVRYVF